MAPHTRPRRARQTPARVTKVPERHCSCRSPQPALARPPDSRGALSLPHLAGPSLVACDGMESPSCNWASISNARDSSK